MMKEIGIRDLKINPYTLFAGNWAALAAGNEKTGFNAMTIAWGQIGALWERKSHSNRLPVATVYVRPSRFTKKLMDESECFSISFMPESEKRALGYLGSHHGQDDRDKIRHAGLTPVPESGTIYMAEAELVLICRKLYAQELVTDGFADRELVPFNYPEQDVHTMYTGEILKVLVREQDTADGQ